MRKDWFSSKGQHQHTQHNLRHSHFLSFLIKFPLVELEPVRAGNGAQMCESCPLNIHTIRLPSPPLSLPHPLPLRCGHQLQLDRRDARCRSTPPPSGSAPPRSRWRWRLRLICLILLGHCSGGASAGGDGDGEAEDGPQRQQQQHQSLLWQMEGASAASHVGLGSGSGRQAATATVTTATAVTSTTEAEGTANSNRGEQIEKLHLSASMLVATAGKETG